jgi:hypothetical protein
MFEVDELLHWAAPTFEHHEILLKMALFEKMYCQQLNVETGEWEQSDPASQHVDHADRPEPDSPEDIQKEFDAIERRLQQLRGPRAPPLSVDNVLALTRKSLPWVWQRDTAQAVLRYVKSDPADAARAGGVLAQDTWDVVYHFVDSASSNVRAAARPVRTSLLPQQSSEQSPEEENGVPGACFKCGMHGQPTESTAPTDGPDAGTKCRTSATRMPTGRPYGGGSPAF